MLLKTGAPRGNVGHNGGDSGAAGVLSVVHPTTSAGAVKSRTPLFDVSGHCVGVVLGDVLTKTIDGSRHMLREPRAIALDAGAVAEAERLGVTQIAVHDRESGRVYRAAFADFLAHSWTFNRGYGLQVAMRLTHWAVDGQTPAPVIAESKAAPVAVQLGLGL